MITVRSLEGGRGGAIEPDGETSDSAGLNLDGVGEDLRCRPLAATPMMYVEPAASHGVDRDGGCPYGVQSGAGAVAVATVGSFGPNHGAGPAAHASRGMGASRADLRWEGEGFVRGGLTWP